MSGGLAGYRDRSRQLHQPALDLWRADALGAFVGYRSAQKPYSGKLLLRVDPDVHAAVAVAAEVAGTSINQWAAQVLSEAAHG
ncbi:MULTISPECIES: toxin-antitoxin system HicB family antitoxin [Thiorhodovibrio]|uniref:toxin-antitoxin system HicB family antitoxin n=1 Tax=Thiorhodovibrio TaxID=61593 RepID=UPI0019126093|nr:toxin-antitoxin system HicB family antitoxin [Thiorhodovibrio winogradskyi]MBK5968687.1 hypothetical protein [Thiorhodovibrio winogradskyi]